MKTETLYDKNYNLLKEDYLELYDKIAKYEKEEESEILVTEIQTEQGRIVPQVQTKDSKKYLLESVYGAEERVERKLEEWGILHQSMPFFFYGFANLDLMRKVYEELGEKCIMFLYEPSIAIFKYYMEHIDMEEILKDWPIYIEIGEYKEGEFESRISGILQIDTIAELKIEVAPNYDILFGENLKKTVEIIQKKFKDFLVNWRTAEEFTDVVGDNMMNNVFHLMHGYNVLQLQGILKNKIPAFVISAGPSLNKNICDLKKAVGKACIIAVDTAIKPLLNHGIKPDFFCIVDGKKPTELMNHPGVSEIPIVACTVVANGIMNLHKGKKFFYASGEAFEDSVWEACVKQSLHKETIYRTSLATGGSVANTAFSLAKFMDASEIILVGQDLALTNDRTHADGTFKKKMDKIDEDIVNRSLWVDGIRGNKVRTLPDFARYLRWFEETIRYGELKNVVDATQGGARIHGTKLMTLKQAINKYCKDEFRMCDEIEKLPEMMDYAAKYEFKKVYEALPEDMERVITNAKKAVRLYKKMKKLAETEKEEMDIEELSKVYKKITKLNDYMNNDKCALFVQSTMMQLNFTMRMGIYKEEDDEKENILVMAKHGITMNYYIMASARYWKEKVENMVKERKPELTEKDLYYPIDSLVKQIKEREA